MMLYANGYGVARDTSRAIHYACRLDTAKAEMEARVAYLASGALAHDDQPFDLCDHITSGRMGGVCAAIDAGRVDADEHLVVADLGPLDVPQFQAVGRAVRVSGDRLHGLQLVRAAQRP